MPIWLFGNIVKLQINAALPNRQVFCLPIITLSYCMVPNLKCELRLRSKLIYRKQIYINSDLLFLKSVCGILGFTRKLQGKYLALVHSLLGNLKLTWTSNTLKQ